MLFDTKAFEVGVDEKVIVVSVDLSPKAEQFAQHQKIRVLKLGQKLPVKPGAREVPTPASQKPVKTEKAGKLLRQQPQPEALQLIPEVMARRYNVIPVAISGRTLEVAMVDPTGMLLISTIKASAKLRRRFLKSPSRMRQPMKNSLLKPLPIPLWSRL
jgi:general secretion pathway protein E